MKKMKILVATAFAAMTVGVTAATTPFEISLFCPPLSIPWCDDVSGLRLDLLSGINRNVSGLDIGTLANITEANGAGLQLCGFYNRVGEGKGLAQFAALMNRCDENYRGIQFAAVYNEVGEQLSGASLAAMNIAKTAKGLQFGIFNTTDRLVGMQFGIVNYADDAERGVQVGLINIMPEARIPVSTIVNIGF